MDAQNVKNAEVVHIPLAPSSLRVMAVSRTLEGMLARPTDSVGLVLFAHGSGSSRHSLRNQYVARILQEANLATLLFDLLTPGEGSEDALRGHLRFDIDLLAERLIAATGWLASRLSAEKMWLGYFGASTGAAAALVAAAELPDLVHAVVSRGGRPDLAGPVLARVQAPTLLIVGSHDREVLRLNQEALKSLRAATRLEIIFGATHLFEEPGTLEQAAVLARDWFLQYLNPASSTTASTDQHPVGAPG
jgi:putative phosphoribosyl transferase